MTTKTKKVVEKTPTLMTEQQILTKFEKAGFGLYKVEEIENKTKEYEGLKKSFYMIKDNYEREKNRLDKVIDSLLNHSKTN